MNRRLTTVLFSALIISAAACYLVYRMVGNELTANAQPKTAQIVLAARTLEIGTLIHEADLKTGSWVGPLPAGAILKKQLAMERGVVSALYEGEPVIESRLASLGSGGGLAATI